jgi:soluble lytic murein transglycosylase-like protein
MHFAAPLVVVILIALIYILSTTDAEASSIRVGFYTRGGLTKIPFAELFDKWSTELDVPWQLMAAIVEKESSFNPSAVNTETAADKRLGRNVDSIGLGQILFPDTAHLFDPNLTREDLLDPDKNLQITAMVLADNLKRYRSKDDDDFPRDAISAYNAGVPRLDPTKTNNIAYVERVKSFWEKYQGESAT